MRYKWGDLISLEYGKPVKDKATLDGPIPVFGTNGKIGTSYLPPLCTNASFILGRKGAYRGVHYSDVPFSVIDTAFYAKNLVPDKLSLKWAYYMFLTYDINSMDSGSAIPSTDRYEIYSIEVELPTLDEQLKAVHLLETFDDKIELNQKINDNLERQAFAFFDNLLTEAQNGECVVSDIAILNPKRSLAKNQPARCIDMARLPTSGAFPAGWETKPFNGGMKFSNGDTLLARITPCLENGKTAFIDFLEDGEVAFGSTEYIVLSPREDVPPEFLYCLARYPVFVDYAVKNMNGSSGRQRVSAETIGQYCLPKLSSEDFASFSEIAVPFFLKMRYNSLENLRLATIRDTFLPKLMSGEINV